MFNREKIENDLKHGRITRKQMNIIYEIAKKKLSLVIKKRCV